MEDFTNTFDFEHSRLTPYSGAHHRAQLAIETELQHTSTGNKHRRLQLKLELAEARLEHFCYSKMLTARDTNYTTTYTAQKAILTAKRQAAKRALNTYEIENQH